MLTHPDILAPEPIGETGYLPTVVNGVVRQINPNPSTKSYVRPSDSATMHSQSPGRFVTSAHGAAREQTE